MCVDEIVRVPGGMPVRQLWALQIGLILRTTDACSPIFTSPHSLTPSHSLPPLPQVGKFKGILDNAVSADRIVKEKFESYLEAMNLLCKPLEELNAAILEGGTQAAAISGSHVRLCVCVCVCTVCVYM